MTSSESDSSGNGKRRKRLKNKTLSWSENVDKITYLSDGESLLQEDRVEEKTSLHTDDSKSESKKAKRQRGTAIEGFQFYTLDDLNNGNSDQQTLLSGESGQEDDSDRYSSPPPLPVATPVVAEETTSFADENQNKSTETGKTAGTTALAKKRPMPLPRKKHTEQSKENNVGLLNGTNDSDDNANTYSQKPPLTRLYDRKPTVRPSSDIMVGATEIRGTQVNCNDETFPLNATSAQAEPAPDEKLENQTAKTESRTSPPRNAPSSAEIAAQIGQSLAKEQDSHRALEKKETQNLQNDSSTKEPATSSRTVHINTKGPNPSQVRYAAKPLPRPNANSVETNIDEVVPQMSDSENEQVQLLPQEGSQPMGPPGPRPMWMPLHMTHGPNQRFFAPGPPGFIPVRGPNNQPMFIPRHMGPPPFGYRPMGPRGPDGRPLGPFGPGGRPFPFNPDQMRSTPPLNGSPYGFQGSSGSDSPVNFEPNMMQNAPTTWRPMGPSPMNGDPGYPFPSPVPSDVSDPRFFTADDGRDYPEGHPMLYPQYGPGAPSTMTGVTMATTLNAMGPSQMQEPHPHLVLSVVTIFLGNFIFGIIALVFSLGARSAIRRGEYAKAAFKGRIALMLSIIGMVFTVIILACLCGFIFSSVG